ncbi:hypothetical protein TNCV_4245851 [Trichonephila clavipes]|nr:hypothetical protein TNCV_4245851 [Trichonephila clavipes]
MPSHVQSNCDAHDTIANGQYGAVWSMGHTQQVCVRMIFSSSPQTSGNSFSGDLIFLRQQETDLPLAEHDVVRLFLLLIGRYICLLQASYFEHDLPVPSTTLNSSFK